MGTCGVIRPRSREAAERMTASAAQVPLVIPVCSCFHNNVDSQAQVLTPCSPLIARDDRYVGRAKRV